MKRRALRRNRPLSCESLEARQLLAGDISFDAGRLTVRMSTDGPAELRVGSTGGNVTISGNATLSATGANRLEAAAVREIVVIGTRRSERVSLSAVSEDNFPNLRGTTISVRGGNDHVIGSHVADTIRGGSGNDQVHGLGGNDRIYGNGGNDRLFGGNGMDVLWGGAGDDWLWGAAYNRDDNDLDIIAGGRGYDTYGFANANIGLNDVLRSIERDRRG